MTRKGKRRSSTSSSDLYKTAQLQSLRDFPRASLPRYLFRAYNDESRGSNGPSEFLSEARKHSIQSALLTTLPADTKRFALDARGHLTYSHDSSFKSPFISFTSSLLIALTCARRDDIKCAGGIRIAVLDTRRISSTSPIFPATALRNVINNFLDGADQLRKAYVDEFLAHDCLVAPTSYVSFNRLSGNSPFRDGPIYKFLGELRSNKLFSHLWPIPQEKLREKLFPEAKTVSDDEIRLIHEIRSLFIGENYDLALTAHLLCLRNRDLDTDNHLKRSVTASFRLEELQNFLKVEDTFDIGKSSVEEETSHIGKATIPRIHKYSSTGHGVDNSEAPELRLYSALVKTMCADLMQRQNTQVVKTMGYGIVEAACGPCVEALEAFTKSLGVNSSTNSTTDPSANSAIVRAQEAYPGLKAAVQTWKQLEISHILNQDVLAALRSLEEEIWQFVRQVRVHNRPFLAQPRAQNVPPARRQRASGASTTSAFGSILASLDQPRKRKDMSEGEQRAAKHRRTL